MKGLVFHFVFCFLLMTAFVFVATPAIAAEITVSSEAILGKVVVTLTYSEVPDPKPTAADIVLVPSTSVTFGEGDDDDPLTYFITWTNLPTAGFAFFGIPPPAINNLSFTLGVYKTVVMVHIGTVLTLEDGVSEDDNLIPDPNYLLGETYVIVAANSENINNGAIYPTLPTIAAPNAIKKVAWTDVSDEPAMPDLYAHFEDGGTLNLRVNVKGTTNRLDSKMEDDTYDDEHGRNQRQVVINEVMWAHDEKFLGSADGIQEQWIELYNTGTTPIQFSDIKLTTSKAFPGAPAETDRLSNLPSFSNIWEIDGKGQHGNSGSPRREFKSMQRVKRDDNYGDGSQSSNWSVATNLYLRNYRGTPGQENRASRLPTVRKQPSRDAPAKNKIIINEIGNFADDELDWIELRNVTNSDQSLKEWVLTKTTGFGNENEIVRFPDKSIPARGVLLLVNKDPSETPLSAGFDIKMDADNQVFGAGPHRYFIVDENKLEIPNNDKWLLILRSNKPWDVGDSRDIYQTGHRVEDVAGPGALHDNFVVLDLDAPLPSWEKKSDGKPDGEVWHTKVFPLNGNTQDDDDFLQSDHLDTAGKVWIRDGGKQGYLKDAWDKVGFTGIGYDRSVSIDDQHGGTPGYDNDVAKGKLSQLDGGRLIVSELMLTTGDRGYPQWIELYNTSKTRGIDLKADSSDPKTGWQIIIENHNSGSWEEYHRNLYVTINLKDLFEYIPPNQTVLIVSSRGRVSEEDYFPEARVARIYEKKKSEFSMANRKDIFLNAEGGFYIKIVDGDGNISDEVGKVPNLRSGIGLDDPFSWNWPTDLTEKGYRTSLIRLRGKNGRPRIGVPNREVKGDMTGAVLPMGTNGRPPRYAWVHAVDTAFKRVPKTWYGNSDDYGTPGYIRGIPLPVSLSAFRATLENGEVVIRWTTESELDNAGFNILRSNNRSNGFKQMNTALIQGAGTTGERSTYKWIDMAVKPGIVYYYQIEDVSFAGEHKVLTTARLKGLISAKDKLTTTWSELKRAH